MWNYKGSIHYPGIDPFIYIDADRLTAFYGNEEKEKQKRIGYVIIAGTCADLYTSNKQEPAIEPYKQRVAQGCLLCQLIRCERTSPGRAERGRIGKQRLSWF